MSENIISQIGRRQRYSFDLTRYAKRPQVQESLTVLLSVSLVVVFLVFAIQPTIVKIAELRVQIAESEKTLAQLSNKATTLGQIAAQWEEIKAKLPFLRRALPFGPDYRTLHKEFVVLANQYEVDLSNLNIGEALIYARLADPYKPEREMGIVKVDYSVRVGGTYEQLVGFLNAMIKTDRVIQIESINFAPETLNKKDNTHPLSLNVAGKIMYLANTNELSKFIDVGGKGGQ